MFIWEWGKENVRRVSFSDKDLSKIRNAISEDISNSKSKHRQDVRDSCYTKKPFLAVIFAPQTPFSIQTGRNLSDVRDLKNVRCIIRAEEPHAALYLSSTGASSFTPDEKRSLWYHGKRKTRLDNFDRPAVLCASWLSWGRSYNLEVGRKPSPEETVCFNAKRQQDPAVMSDPLSPSLYTTGPCILGTTIL